MLKAVTSIILFGFVVLLSTACLGQRAPASSATLTNIPSEDGPDAVFARAMMAHHAQAVEMSLNLRDRSSDPEIRLLALDIILMQQNQIGQMQGWLAAWNVPVNGREPPMQGMAQMMGMATQPQVNALRTLPIAEAETSFLKLMIRHHQGGVTMAQDALQRAQRPEVLRLANTIVKSQQSEIEYMQSLLAQRGAPITAPALTPAPHSTATPMPMNH
jgi:uncharacterized protein (DUF305 family)